MGEESRMDPRGPLPRIFGAAATAIERAFAPEHDHVGQPLTAEEQALLAEAEADIAAGRTVPGEAVSLSVAQHVTFIGDAMLRAEKYIREHSMPVEQAQRLRERATAAETRQASAERAAASLSASLAAAMKAQRRPKVGVAVLVHRADGRLLLGLRKGSPGAGTWSVPGGHLEADESVAACAARELAEETGIVVAADAMRVLDTWTHDRMPAEWGTYVTLWCAVTVPADTEARLMEPENCGGWTWVGVGEGWPGPLFRCFQSLYERLGEAVFDPPQGDRPR